MVKKDDLKKIKSGGKWTAVGAIAGVFSQLLIMLSLALFLSPEDVGLFSIFLFVLGLGITLLPLGNDFSFVQADKLATGDLRRTILLSGGFSVVAAIAAYPIALTFGNFGQSIANTIVFGITVGFAEAVFLLCSAALQRDLNYRAIEKANIVRQLLTLVLSIGFLALFHRIEGAFAGRLVSNLIALGLITSPLLSSLERGKPVEKLMTHVSRDMLAKNVLGHISRNAEVVAGSPQLGVQGLGIYDLGRRIVAQPRDFIGSILFKFTYPMFSKIVKIEKVKLRNRFLRLTYRNVIKAAALVGFPVFAIALLLANPLITEIFGEDWRAAIWVVQIFSLTAFVQVLGNNIITAALTAVGGSAVVLKAEYVILVPRLLAVFVASFYGPVAIAAAMSGFILAKLLWMQWELNKLSTLTFGLVAKASRPMFLATLVGLAVGSGVKLVLAGVLGAVVGSLCFVAVYGAILLTLDPRLPKAIIKRLKRRKGKPNLAKEIA